MKNTFDIDLSFVCGVTTTTTQSTLENPDNPTPEDLIKIIKGTHQWTTTSSGDHPEFAKLRNELEEKGFIQTERSYWNADWVMETFTLNGVKFKPGVTFYSAMAMRYTLLDKKI